MPASKLTMDNVPWHEEVIEFVEKLNERLTGYAIASEHEHSNCILLADKKFLIDGKWNTWIDYQR
jgi:tRNA wybutosine-synthesizing protein 1